MQESREHEGVMWVQEARGAYTGARGSEGALRSERASNPMQCGQACALPGN